MKEQILTFEELNEVVDLVEKVYGFNFHNYARASLKRRVSRIMELNKYSLFDLKSTLVNSPSFFEDFLKQLTVNVTEMFRDPNFFDSLRKNVMPYLASYPRIKVWNA